MKKFWACDEMFENAEEFKLGGAETRIFLARGIQRA
jgi:hypothetical protein